LNRESWQRFSKGNATRRKIEPEFSGLTLDKPEGMEHGRLGKPDETGDEEHSRFPSSVGGMG
jgi:hypothetical protein